MRLGSAKEKKTMCVQIFVLASEHTPARSGIGAREMQERSVLKVQ
jgi:hypothetical protein